MKSTRSWAAAAAMLALTGSAQAALVSLDFAGSTAWRPPDIREYAALFGTYGDLAQVGEFMDVQASYYWSGTEVSGGIVAWAFAPTFGQAALSTFQTSCLAAVAVRSGDVITPVPEP
jgi:hypothetical protein